MIERIPPSAIGPLASAAPPRAAEPDAASVVAGIGAAAIQGLGAPLAAIAEAGAARLGAASGTGDPVAIGQLQRDVLDFAREAKALALGNPERSADEITARVDEAIAAGRDQAAALPAVGDDIALRDGVLLRAATQHLANGF